MFTFIRLFFWPIVFGFLLVWVFPGLKSGAFAVGLIIYMVIRFVMWWNGKK